MKVISFVLLIIFAPAAWAIYGGTRSPNHFQDVIHWQNTVIRQGCSGIMIHPNLMLTVGHCLFGVKNMKVVSVGDRYYDVVPIVNPLLRKDFYRRPTAAEIVHDILFLYFRDPPISAEELSAVDRNVESKNAVVVGTGYFDEKSDRVDSASLGRRYTSMTLAPYAAIKNLLAGTTESMKSVCLGDSGGGVYQNGRLVGLVSASMAKSLSCNGATYKAYIVDLSLYEKVIRNALDRVTNNQLLDDSIFE